jgi:geranylgeranyl reductase family protein
MDACDVLIVGGGPAGSSCAWTLRQAGFDVMVIDRATFPRDKVCAGWITPQVVADLRIDIDEYRRARTFQPIAGFKVGLIGATRELEIAYDHAISFGIRRCEFDQYLLKRAGARLRVGTSISTLCRERGQWVVNGSVQSPLLVGAGGHFCPVARWLNPTMKGAAVVAAQEVEFPIPPDETSWALEPEMPELYFCGDLKGYGWCFRKEQHVNVGLGRVNGRSLPAASTEFVRFLEARRKVPRGVSWRWRGHAYLLSTPACRQVVDAGVMLIGDAAGLAYPQSGEGIRPAVESGLLAAATIIEAKGDYSRRRLEPYKAQLADRFGGWSAAGLPWATPIAAIATALLPWLLDVPWFVRKVLLDRWFLHAHEPALRFPRGRAADSLRA